jgi:transcriptional regulator with XRE-family HTH domain
VAVAGRKKKSEATPKPAVALNLTFGPNLKRCRKAAGYTQEQLAHLAGVHPTEIGRLERGRRSPGFDVTMRLIGALAIEADELYKGGVWMPPEEGRPGRFDYKEQGS